MSKIYEGEIELTNDEQIIPKGAFLVLNGLTFGAPQTEKLGTLRERLSPEFRAPLVITTGSSQRMVDEMDAQIASGQDDWANAQDKKIFLDNLKTSESGFLITWSNGDNTEVTNYPDEIVLDNEDRVIAQDTSVVINGETYSMSKDRTLGELKTEFAAAKNVLPGDLIITTCSQERLDDNAARQRDAESLKDNLFGEHEAAGIRSDGLGSLSLG